MSDEDINSKTAAGVTVLLVVLGVGLFIGTLIYPGSSDMQEAATTLANGIAQAACINQRGNWDRFLNICSWN